MARTVILKESQLALLREEEEVTFYSFFTNVKKFIVGLLNDPIDTDVNQFFKDKKISKERLINVLRDYSVINKDEDIKEVNDEETRRVEVQIHCCL